MEYFTPGAGNITGGWTTADPTSTEVSDMAAWCMNTDFPSVFYNYKVISAKTQVVAGIKYMLDIAIKTEQNCIIKQYESIKNIPSNGGLNKLVKSTVINSNADCSQYFTSDSKDISDSNDFSSMEIDCNLSLIGNNSMTQISNSNSSCVLKRKDGKQENTPSVNDYIPPANIPPSVLPPPFSVPVPSRPPAPTPTPSGNFAPAPNSIYILPSSAPNPISVVLTPCSYSSWAPSGAIVTTGCKTGIQTMTRSATDGGKGDCTAPTTSKVPVGVSDTSMCPSCGYGAWAPSGNVTTTGCKTGIQTIIRTAIDGGKGDCNAVITSTVPVGVSDTSMCPSCGYGAWAPSGTATVTGCKTGNQMITRTATDGGKGDCTALTTSTVPVGVSDTTLCPSCGYGAWAPSGTATVTGCKTGIQTVTRTATDGGKGDCTAITTSTVPVGVSDTTLCIYPSITATGSYIVTYSNLYILVVFTGNGTLSLDKTMNVEVLLVGGGGGGGAGNTSQGGCGGGGAGGVGMGTLNLTSNTNYTITVGAGGQGVPGGGQDPGPNQAGRNSTLVGGAINEVAYGGGAGGCYGTSQIGLPGGSSGGDFWGSAGRGFTPPTKGSGSLTYYGNTQGDTNTGSGGSGGGGAGTKGVDLVAQSSAQAGAFGGNGGDGKIWQVNSQYYGGGGGGGNMYHGGDGDTRGYQGFLMGYGGIGGGGNGLGTPGGISLAPTNGAPNTGGGGGGSARSYGGGSGGSGVCIFAFKYALDGNSSFNINGKNYLPSSTVSACAYKGDWRNTGLENTTGCKLKNVQQIQTIIDNGKGDCNWNNQYRWLTNQPSMDTSKCSCEYKGDWQPTGVVQISNCKQQNIQQKQTIIEYNKGDCDMSKEFRWLLFQPSNDTSKCSITNGLIYNYKFNNGINNGKIWESVSNSWVGNVNGATITTRDDNGVISPFAAGSSVGNNFMYFNNSAKNPLNNDPTWKNNIDSSMQYTQIPTINSSTFSTQITVSLWLYVTEDVGFASAFSSATNQGNYFEMTTVGSNYNFGWLGRDWYGGTVVNNKWAHFCVSINTETPLINVYIDNQLLYTTSVRVAFPKDLPTYLGVDSSQPYIYFHGGVADVRIYNRALDTSEVSMLYNSR